MWNVPSEVVEARDFLWLNPDVRPFAEADPGFPLDGAMVEDAAARLLRFAPFLKRRFPETGDGIIESPLTETPRMQAALSAPVPGRLFLKRDGDLPIAGSVKARGGIYEVLCRTEELALKAGILRPTDDYSVLADHRDFFAQYKMQVGSTGNLGLSIGIMSAAIGYQAIVHMSSDARRWKKDLLRRHGVTVKEYDGDYSAAVREGRRLSDAHCRRIITMRSSRSPPTPPAWLRSRRGPGLRTGRWSTPTPRSSPTGGTSPPCSSATACTPSSPSPFRPPVCCWAWPRARGTTSPFRTSA